MYLVDRLQTFESNGFFQVVRRNVGVEHGSLIHFPILHQHKGMPFDDRP